MKLPNDSTGADILALQSAQEVLNSRACLTLGSRTKLSLVGHMSLLTKIDVLIKILSQSNKCRAPESRWLKKASTILLMFCLLIPQSSSHAD